MKPQTKSKDILNIFTEISKIPRTSGNEAEVAKWLLNWATSHDFKTKQDDIGNIVITIPATKGYESKPGYVLQGHMDIVGQKTEDSSHDFAKDPIIPVIDGDWLKTNGETTLGADNGIAIAMALALVLTDSPRPTLELLFTVDEETGLTGALELGGDMLTQKALINLDSEDMGYITIGCAGSSDSTIEKGYITEGISGNSELVKISLKGGNGGHSGVEVHKKIANTHVLMARFLKGLSEECDVNIVKIKGGTVRNAIPRSTEALIYLSKDNLLDNVKNRFIKEILEGEYGSVEKNLKLTVENSSLDSLKQLTTEDSREVISTMLAIPHGVLAMSNEVDGLVETSNNFAIIDFDANIEIESEAHIKYLTMHRSSVDSSITDVTARLESLAVILGADFEVGSSSPAWQPNPDSDLVKQVANKYEELFKKKPVIEAIHAGLECGVIGEKFNGMEMVSFGPTIKGAHTPEERLLIGDIDKVMVWLEAILAD